MNAMVPLSMQPATANLALINVMFKGDYQFDQEIPLGLGAVAAFIRQQGFSVCIHQCFADRGEEHIEAAAGIRAPVYGFSLNMVNLRMVQRVAQKIRLKEPDAILVLGGPFLPSLAEPILQSEPAFDCMVVGEGELTMLELVQTACRVGRPDLSTIPGLVWRRADGTTVRNPLRPLIPDLDVLPFPARDFLTQAQRDPVDQGLLESIRIVTSRGCIAQCSFCSVNFYTKLQRGKIWRGRSASNVVDELEHLIRTQGARLFNFADSSFEDPGRKGKRRTRAICEDIIARKLPLSAKVYMRGDTMLDDDDDELLRLWKRAGVDVIIVGAESGSDLELDFYQKRATVAQNVKTIRKLQSMDLFYVQPGLIMFGPNSTMETVRTNIAFMLEMGLSDNPFPISNILMLIRDSKLYTILKEEGRVIEPENFWELPKYHYLDPVVRRVASFWDGIFGNYPLVLPLNENQVNFENLITRMTNPMNAEIRARIEQPFSGLKSRYLSLKKEFGQVQHDYFVRVLDMVEAGSPDGEIEKQKNAFFNDCYAAYLPRYQELYNSAVTLIADTGLGMSGMMFKNFYSNIVNAGMKRV